VQNKAKLLDQVRDVIRRRHFSVRTEEAYKCTGITAARLQGSRFEVRRHRRTLDRLIQFPVVWVTLEVFTGYFWALHALFKSHPSR
jgi:hypothetical protein